MACIGAGKPKYTVVCKLGAGAFATVYKLAARSGGQLFAAKELEKRRFIKEGRMDMRLENELLIMKSIRHPHVVNYVDYHEEEKYLLHITGARSKWRPSGISLQQRYPPRATGTSNVLAGPSSSRLPPQAKRLHTEISTGQHSHRELRAICGKAYRLRLSKVVKNNETFLKTFCGPLLYCAPEVFPNYDQQKRSVKRRHGGPVPKSFHSYSHSVDVWSYAAVLYLPLFGARPLSKRIRSHRLPNAPKDFRDPLDLRPLRSKGISDSAIDLVSRMLTKDPSNDRQIGSVWPILGSRLGTPCDNRARGAILNPLLRKKVRYPSLETKEAQAFSQLSITEEAAAARGVQHETGDDEFDFDDEDLDFLGPRASKR